MDGMPSLDQQLAIRATTRRLSDEFAGRIAADTVARFMDTSYHQLADVARIRTMVPLLAERYAHDQLTALARIEGHGADTPLVLVLCEHNSGRSQMAMGFVRDRTAGRVLAWSGGSQPRPDANPVAIQAMREVGIDIADAHPNPWTDEIVRAANVVVTMNCADDVPRFDDIHYEEWDLPHISGRSLDEVRPVRDEIADRVDRLLTLPMLASSS